MKVGRVSKLGTKNLLPLFNLPQAEVESTVEPNGATNYIWWEPMAFISIHRLIPAITAA
ncbi:MAG: hypothetical protein ACJA2O_002696 [Candidatus Azotimanducaceae bacterium]|jgi:hypothetical protein